MYVYSILSCTKPRILSLAIGLVLWKHHFKRIVNLDWVIGNFRELQYQAFGLTLEQHPLQGVERQAILRCRASHIDMCTDKPGLDNAAIRKLCFAIVRKNVLRFHGFTVFAQGQRMAQVLC